MEIYFNPYPGAAKTEDEGLQCAIGTVDAFLRLQNGFNGISLSSKISETYPDLPLSSFVLVRNENIIIDFNTLMSKATKEKHDKLLSLLIFFSKGKIIDNKDINNVEDWILSGIGVSAPVLELAAKNKAIALTIPTEPEWRVDLFKFDNRQEKLHNLWGQDDISAIISHCVEQIKNTPERFSAQFNAVFCGNALNSAPDFALWDRLRFFQTMNIAKQNDYKEDGKWIKFLEGVERTQFGTLYELRPYGHRIFFVHRKGLSPEILIGGFYQKGQGNNSKAQNHAIKNAKENIDNYSGNAP